MVAFRKMHGLGNDFAVFDGRGTRLAMNAALARALADRRLGIGCDQILVIEPSAGADAFMRIFNADGGEVESCGNGVRCVARLLLDETGKSQVRVDSKGGVMVCTRAGTGISVDMGPPRFDWREIPLAQAVETQAFALPVPGVTDASLNEAAALSMGNPHLVLFVPDAEAAPVDTLGPLLEHHPWFPARTNVEFVEVRGGTLRMRVWERGVGITRACGTGACAAAVAAAARGVTGRSTDVQLDGGTLHIAWRESDDHVVMTGPAVTSFTGEVDFADLMR